LSDLQAGLSAGAHFVSEGGGPTTHGCPPTSGRHTGDMVCCSVC